MGLAFSIYKGLQEVKGEELEELSKLDPEEIEYDDEKYVYVDDYSWQEKDFPNRADDIKNKTYYTFESQSYENIGGYIMFHLFRTELLEFEENSKFKKFLEFYDCDGILGTETCQELFKVFDETKEEFYKKCTHGGYRAIYKRILESFEIAKDGGMIIYC